MRELRMGLRPEDDFGSRALCQLVMATDEIGVKVGLQNVLDA